MERLEFERRLRDSGASPQLSFIISHHREMIVEVQKQLDTLTSTLLALAESLEGFVKLSEVTQQRIIDIEKGQRHEGIIVESEELQ